MLPEQTDGGAIRALYTRDEWVALGDDYIAGLYSQGWEFVRQQQDGSILLTLPAGLGADRALS